MKDVGYLLNGKDGLEGESGLYYNYILAQNGVLLQVDGSLLSARVSVAVCEVRGLGPLEVYVTLKHGKIPQALFDLALNTAIANKEKEVYFAITWDGAYHLYLTPQQGEEGKVKYDVLENTIMDIHSHGKLIACFSAQDDADEQGLRLSCVIGTLHKTPTVRTRSVVYGSFCPLRWTDVFSGRLIGAVDTEEEAKSEDELQSESELLRSTENMLGGHWWDRLFVGRWPF